jgi:DNA modification methylase
VGVETMEIYQLKMFDEPSITLTNGSSIQERIDIFANFSYKDSPYCKRNWGNPLHSLCSYQSKLKPAIAHSLIKTLTKEGDRVLDPFSGVGTIPLEACLQGRIGHGVDINPIAYANTLAKVDFPHTDDLIDFLERLGNYIEKNIVSEKELASFQLNNINGNLQEYFHKNTFAEIVTARKFFAELESHTPVSALVLSCLLHILHGNRPYALSRRSHGITPFSPTGPYEYKSLTSHLRSKIYRSIKIDIPSTYVRGSAHYCSIFNFESKQPYDVIITSPPFLNSTRFYIANWLRLWFCGWEENDFKATERGDYLEVMQAKTINVYENVLSKLKILLMHGGLCVLHLGVVGKRDMGIELMPLAKKIGFKVLSILYEDVSSCERHGLRDQGSTRKHEFLFLQAPFSQAE